MTRKQFNCCIAAAQNYSNRDAYINDIVSAIWEKSEISAQRIKDVGTAYDAQKRTAKDIAIASGMSARKLAERFSIPYRTMENWCGGQRVAPQYVLLMMQECLGLLPEIENKKDE
jgi:hypothetical protein